MIKDSVCDKRKNRTNIGVFWRNCDSDVHKNIVTRKNSLEKCYWNTFSLVPDSSEGIKQNFVSELLITLDIVALKNTSGIRRKFYLWLIT